MGMIILFILVIVGIFIYFYFLAKTQSEIAKEEEKLKKETEGMTASQKFDFLLERHTKNHYRNIGLPEKCPTIGCIGGTWQLVSTHSQRVTKSKKIQVHTYKCSKCGYTYTIE